LLHLITKGGGFWGAKPAATFWKIHAKPQSSRQAAKAAEGRESKLLSAPLREIFFKENIMPDNQLLETWQIHDRINLYLLDAVDPASLESHSASKGRSVGEQFAHIHNVRLMWLKASAPDLLKGLTKIEKEQANDKKLLRKSLVDSGVAIGTLLTKSLEAGGKVKGFKPHAAAFLGYLISHESHHRGQIALSLKQAGKPLDKKVGFGMWEWGVR
jgi:uncharacterized damage-inducible protein DinB